MRASQTDSVASASGHPAQSQNPDQQLLTGKFYFTDGNTYEGQYKLLGGVVVAAVDAAGAKKGVKKAKEDDVPPPPAEPPRPLRHGQGTFTCGAYSYTGDWVDDEMHGQGRFSFASRATYQGAFEHNKFHGEGTYTFADGKTCQGQWLANVLHGQGRFTGTDGHQWCGQFYNGAGPGLTCQL